MCGILGMMDWGNGAIGPNKLGTFMQLLHSGALRGMHGTGMFAVDKEGSSLRLRVGGPPHYLVGGNDFKKMENFVQEKWVRFLVGHNRFKTTGDIKTEHSHPFRDGEIILVHNGTLEGFKHLPDAKNYEVDSEAICHAIAVQGVEKTISTLRGAWALVWYDGAKKTINFLRNKERPLFLARHEKEPFIAFASEEGMLRWILNRNGMYMIQIEALPEDQLFSYSLDSTKPHVKELKGKGVKGFKDSGWDAWGEEMRKQATGSGKARVEQDKVIQLPAPKQNSSTNSVGTHSSAIGNRGSLQGKKKDAVRSSQDAQCWVRVDVLHELYTDKSIEVIPLDYRAIDTDKAKEDGLFLVRALSDDFPDIEFKCNVKGLAAVETLMEASHGMRAQIRSILRSMKTPSKHPHEVILYNPEPIFFREPKVPEHAHTDVH